MYTNQEKLVLMCAASRGDVARVKQVAREIDSNSFIIIANAREVVGLGFKNNTLKNNHKNYFSKYSNELVFDMSP